MLVHKEFTVRFRLVAQNSMTRVVGERGVSIPLPDFRVDPNCLTEVLTYDNMAVCIARSYSTERAVGDVL